MLQTYVEKAYEEKRGNGRDSHYNSTKLLLFAKFFPVWFFFLNIYLCYNTILLSVDCLLVPHKTLKPFISQWSRFTTGITAPQLSGTVTVYIS